MCLPFQISAFVCTRRAVGEYSINLDQLESSPPLQPPPPPPPIPFLPSLPHCPPSSSPTLKQSQAQRLLSAAAGFCHPVFLHRQSSSSFPRSCLQQQRKQKEKGHYNSVFFFLPFTVGRRLSHYNSVFFFFAFSCRSAPYRCVSYCRSGQVTQYSTVYAVRAIFIIHWNS